MTTLPTDDRSSRQFDIGGMDCADCAQGIERRVSQLPGVLQASLSFVTAKLTVQGGGAVFQGDAIERAVASMGYRATRAPDGRSFHLHVGSMRLMEERNVGLNRGEGVASKLEEEGKSVLLLSDDHELLGVIAVADQLRPEAREALQRLRRAGIKKQIMLTGDNEGTARAIALQVGLDEFRAQLLPEDKVEAVRELKRRYGKVAMAGDGINDAPAMAEADLGVAMGAAGTDVAIETGDLVLMADDLSRLPYALHLSGRAVANMRQNVVASLLIVAFLIPAALSGLVGLVPGLLINEVSALVVIANALRLLR